MIQYLALLRGINVGGKNLIKMAELRACVEVLGFANVRTYIQTGNVLFYAEQADRAALTRQLEAALSETFRYSLPVVVRSHEKVHRVVSEAPPNFGTDPAAYRYDVIFLKEPLTSAEAMQSISTKDGVDQAHAGDGVLYFSRLTSKASSSHLTRIVSLPVYQSMTIRNWNTTTRLLGLMEDAAKSSQ